MADGTRSKFTPVITGAIIEHLRAGATRRAAADAVGVDESTLSKWVSARESFSSAVLRAEAEAELRNVQSVAKAADGYEVTRTKETIRPDGTREIVTETSREFDWRAAESWLKRRRPEEWGDRLDVKQLPDDAVIRMLNRAAGQRSREAGPGDPAGVAVTNGNGQE